MTFSVKEIVWR